MAIQAAFSHNFRTRRRARGSLLVPFGLFLGLLLTAGSFIAYVLWPTWPAAPVPLDAPALPITIGETLFQIPPAAIRTAVQRHPGPHQRIDLAFLWPSLAAPQQNANTEANQLKAIDNGDPAAVNGRRPPTDASGRLFVTIAPLASLLPPLDRLHSIYPHYLEGQATVGADGLAIVPFRTGTPYEGQDLIYLADNPDRLFTLCTRDGDGMPGTCIHERILGDADITLRFPRAWLKNWKSVADGFDRLLAQLHPLGS